MLNAVLAFYLAQGVITVVEHAKSARAEILVQIMPATALLTLQE